MGATIISITSILFFPYSAFFILKCGHEEKLILSLHNFFVTVSKESFVGLNGFLAHEERIQSSQ